MNKILRSVAATAAAAALTLSGAAYYPSMNASDTLGKAAAADDCNDDWLHAKGSRLYDMNGNEVWLTGANWFGMNCTENFPHGLWSADVDDFLSSVADHGINIIRFPISTELLMSWQNGSPYACEGLNPKNTDGYQFNPDFCHADGSEMNSMEVFDVIMQKCKKYGIKALVDVHSPSSHNSGHNYELWYYEKSSKTADDMATIKEEKYASNAGAQITFDDWIDSITWLAKKYSNDDTIIAYDLKNEPHGKRGYDGTTCPSDIAKWDDSNDTNNWKYASETCANSILAVNPNALILIEGIEQYPKTDQGYTFDTPDIWNAPADQSPWYGAWWGGNLRGVKDYPVTPKSGTSQIVYSPHDYGPSVYAQTWFDKDFTTQTLLDDYWYDTWAYINDQDIAPLLIGEWGGHMDAGANQKWMELLRDYMIDHHINHTFWCLNPNSGDTGGLLDSQFKNWDTKKYELFEKSLWQTSDGKYISLDHQTALGKNGLSLNEFYSSGAKSNLDGGKAGGGTPVIVDKTTTTTAKPVTTTTTSKTTTTTVTTTAPVKTVKCEHCGKEIPESEAIYGPLGFPVCQECYDNGVYIGTSAPPPPTTTTTTTTVTTTTSLTTTEPQPSTHPGYKFKSVESYPTKTVYNVGDNLDLNGLQFSGTPMQGAGSGGGRYTNADLNPSSVTIFDGEENSYNTVEFSKLPAGEYTVNIHGMAGDYYRFTYCYGINISYKVTIKDDVTTTTSPNAEKTDALVWGDANNDGGVDMADVVLIMQSLANPNKYGLTGTDKNHITSQGLSNASVVKNNGSVTTEDALQIQLFLLGKFDPKASK